MGSGYGLCQNQPGQSPPPPPPPVVDPKAQVELRPLKYSEDGQPVHYVRDIPTRATDGR